MARSRRSGGRRSRRGSRRSGGQINLLLIVLVVAVAVFIVMRRSQDSPATAGPPSTTMPLDTPAAELLASLPVMPEVSRDGYEREAFGDGWLVDQSGCDTRNQVLAAESRVPVTRGADGCSVAQGEWVSLYDGYTTPNPDELDIDHMVPLAEAWDSGASLWPPEQREQYANDTVRPDALVAVTTAMNQSKSDSDPAEWMPPNRDSWCRYVEAWITQKAAWQLTIDVSEHDALSNVLATC
jgi:hypothetical protein